MSNTDYIRFDKCKAPYGSDKPILKRKEIVPEGISRKFYLSIRDRINNSFNSVFANHEALSMMHELVFNYISSGTEPKRNVAAGILLAFSLLKPEIDKAMARSAAARRRAAERKARQEQEKNSKDCDNQDSTDTTDTTDTAETAKHTTPVSVHADNNTVASGLNSDFPNGETVITEDSGDEKPQLTRKQRRNIARKLRRARARKRS